MRGLFVLLAIAGTAPLVLAYPHVGVLIWSWLSFMNPHRMGWGMAVNFPVAAVAGGIALVAWAIGRERKLPVGHPLVYLMAAYLSWVTLTSVVSINPDLSWHAWKEFAKIMLFSLMVATLITSKSRINALVWVMALSFGYYGIKGGISTILGGGTGHVWGPPGSFIGDNNTLGLALNMTIPLIRYLQIQATDRRLKMVLMGALILTILGILGTQSRGAMLGLATILFIYFMRTRGQRIYALLFAAVGVSLALFFMPASWLERMETIETYQSDGSAMGRIQMWRFSIDIANENPITGGGFDVVYDEQTQDRLLPPEIARRAVHSIYFEVLSEHGYAGLLLFLIIGFTALGTAGRIKKRCRDVPSLEWAHHLGGMLQLSLIAYATNGAFLNMGVFDYYWELVALTASLAVLTQKAAVESRLDIADSRNLPLRYA